jgi:hypothetical protein
MSDFVFDNIEEMQRNRALEKDGIEIGLPGNRVLIVRAASDANPQWRARSEQIGNELRRMQNAKAPPERVRAYLARIYAELLVKDWRGVTAHGVAIPYSVDAGAAFLLAADDAYAAVDQIVYDTKNFRSTRIDAILEEVKNS